MEKQATEPDTAATEEAVNRAAEAIRNATAVLFTSGAGLGVDSGLPDFRGPEGFWRAYPPMKALGLDLPRVSNPCWFDRDKAMAWGFWGHRYGLYAEAEPHKGYHLMLEIGQQMRDGFFAYTSNVDGHFARHVPQLFPEDRIIECHGCIHYVQCCKPRCSGKIWPASDSLDLATLGVDHTTFRATGALPSCPRCNGVARPNVLMFDDYGWLSARYDEQESNYKAWLNSLKEKDDTRLVVVEIGAGTTIPTVRRQSQKVAATFDTLFGRGEAVLVRINPTEHQCPVGIFTSVSVPLGGLAALTRIATALSA